VLLILLICRVLCAPDLLKVGMDAFPQQGCGAPQQDSTHGRPMLPSTWDTPSWGQGGATICGNEKGWFWVSRPRNIFVLARSPDLARDKVKRPCPTRFTLTSGRGHWSTLISYLKGKPRTGIIW
jgi:hypothetical protein